jgi:hypothetical protein
MRFGLCAALVGALLLASLASPRAAVAAPTEQQLEDSRAAFRRGVDDAKRGDYTAARASFLRAYQLYPHPSILLNLGIARAHTGEYLEAEQDLVHFLADDGGAPANEIASARSELADVRTHLGTFRLRAAPSGARARLDTRALALIPGAFVEVRTTVGSHSLHVEADGFKSVDRDVVVDATRGEIDLALTAVRGGGSDAATDDGIDRATTGWIVVGSAVVVGGFGLASGVHAKSLADGYNTPGSGTYQDAATRSTGIAFRTLADVAFIVSIAAGGVGIYLLATPAPSRAAPPASARVVVGPGFGGVVGSF